MKTTFAQPRFTGARFDENTLPLEVAKDLAAYEILIVELAKHLYLKDHPERQRVAKGFDSDFQLHLQRVDPGSAKPVLCLLAAGALALGGGTGTYFEQARDLVVQCISAPANQLPADFPRELLSHFNRVGRSLRPDEHMELMDAGGSVATLTPERRKNLVLAADTVYERPINLAGTIVEVNWEKSSFQLRLIEGNLIVVPMPESFHSQARNCGGRSRHQVTVIGGGAFDSWDNLQKVVSVDSLEVQPDYMLASVFDELRSMEDGWYDGQGKAPNKDKIDFIASKMISHYPEKLPIPAIVPTPEGNLLFEWDSNCNPSLDILMPDLTAEYHAFKDGSSDIEQTLHLSLPDEWDRLYRLVSDTIGSHSA